MAIEEKIESKEIKEKMPLPTKIVIGAGIAALLFSVGLGIKYLKDNHIIEKTIQQVVYSPYQGR